MASIKQVRAALAAQIYAETGLVTKPRMPDQLTPPVCVILPGSPYAKYGITLGDPTLAMPVGQQVPVATELNLRVAVFVSLAPSLERAQDAVDAYLGLEPSDTVTSIPLAILSDPTLGGAVEYAEPIDVVAYSTEEVAGQQYFRGMLRVNISVTQDLGA